MRQNDMEFARRHIGECFLPEQFFGCQQVFFHDLQPAPSVEALVDKGVYQRIGILRPPLKKGTARRGGVDKCFKIFDMLPCKQPA